jgi:hypothetical protein
MFGRKALVIAGSVALVGILGAGIAIAAGGHDKGSADPAMTFPQGDVNPANAVSTEPAQLVALMSPTAVPSSPTQQSKNARAQVARSSREALLSYVAEQRAALVSWAASRPADSAFGGVTLRVESRLSGLVSRLRAAGLQPTYVEWFEPTSDVHGGAPASEMAAVLAEHPSAASSFALAQGSVSQFAEMGKASDVWLVDVRILGSDGAAQAQGQTAGPGSAGKVDAPLNLRDSAKSFGVLDR